jgi:23S rRNA (cytidine1920-2'-O)/16S rRNA (cytidine1409-2'-O)-methyltransferase
MKQRLDQSLVERGLVTTRSQAESYIKLGNVKVDERVITKPGFAVRETDKVELTTEERYVSRGALKLASVAEALELDFKDKVVLDVGSSTGGFTDYALQHDAKMVIAVEAGKDQLHPSLQGHSLIELHEQTDIRDIKELSQPADIAVIDVSFVSLRDVLPHVAKLVVKKTDIVAMVKPQFEAGGSVKHKGVIKNDKLRRDILKRFEDWSKEHFIIVNKADSAVAGAKGNRERFYLLQKA